jgi:hypothetical protein
MNGNKTDVRAGLGELIIFLDTGDMFGKILINQDHVILLKGL